MKIIEVFPLFYSWAIQFERETVQLNSVDWIKSSHVLFWLSSNSIRVCLLESILQVGSHGIFDSHRTNTSSCQLNVGLRYGRLTISSGKANSMRVFAASIAEPTQWNHLNVSHSNNLLSRKAFQTINRCLYFNKEFHVARTRCTLFNLP